MLLSYKQWIILATSRLQKSLHYHAKLDAEIILMQVTNTNRSQILTYNETLLTEYQYDQLGKMLIRRERGEPISYIIGEHEFWSLPLKISTGIFIPRPETECLVQLVLDLLPIKHIKVLDLGTGSGAISLALASERPSWNITGIDRSRDALSIAYNNAKKLKINNVKFYQSYWFKSLPKKSCYNLIVSNPPYIANHDTHLDKLNFEPRNALVSNNNGLQDLQIICYRANKYLYPNSWLILEHGYRQGKKIRNLLYKTGFSKIFTIRDYSNKERVSAGKWL